MNDTTPSWKQILDAAEKEADAIAEEMPDGLEMKSCRRCKGTGIYRFVTGATGECASCFGGSVFADQRAWTAFLLDRETRRLRVLWAANRAALTCYGIPKNVADEAMRFMRSIELRAATVKANPKMIA